MGLTLTLTDVEIPASPAFIEFLHATLNGGDYHVGEWFFQEGENLVSDKGRYEDIQEKAKEVLSNPSGKEMVIQSYRFFKEMLTGRPNILNRIKQYHFYFIVGIPRTGGTYLTKQLFRIIDVDYKKVQNALAHDGFPHLAQLEFKRGSNVHTNGLLQLAEYLTMVDVYYKNHHSVMFNGKIVVPKKFTKAVYNFPLIQEVFGDNAHYLITLRHPLPFIQSVLDKSGGMPANGLFTVRSAIERWALDDWLNRGVAEADVRAMPYVDVMLGYWKRFHYQMALSGMPGMPNARIIPYGEASMLAATHQLCADMGCQIEPEVFKVSTPPDFPESDLKNASTTLQEVENFWKGLGLDFPAESLKMM